MGSMLGDVPAGVRPEAVYVIFSADITGPERAIEAMGPAYHLPAGYKAGSYRERVGQVVASRFTLTEGDEQYDFGYLGDESSPPRPQYYPAGYLDAEGTELADDGTVEELPDEDLIGQGRHRKWVAELTYAEWRIFADRYIIGLDEHGLPESYEDTMGSLTEYGVMSAVAVDNREGWDHPAYGNCYMIDSQFYLSFAFSAADMPAAVVDEGTGKVIARFFTPGQASEYIGGLPGAADGRYGIDMTEAGADSEAAAAGLA